jgi:hypothetical protein
MRYSRPTQRGFVCSTGPKLDSSVKSEEFAVKLRNIIAAAFVMLGLTVAVGAQFRSGLGNVEGDVLNSQGKPVADASVTIQTSDGLHPHATHTNANGHFVFTRYDAGQYDLRGYFKGSFTEWSKHQVIRPNKTTTITLHLPPDSSETVVVPTK